MPTHVSYNGKRLIPAPICNIQKSYQKSTDGQIVGSIFAITITGTLVAYKGSPSSAGVFHTTSGYPADETILTEGRLEAILRKQDAIRDLFSDEGKLLEIQSANASAPLKFNPRILDISFGEDIWHDLCNYTITLEADLLYPEEEEVDTIGSGYFIAAGSESWVLETDPTAEDTESPQTYRLTHTVSAEGKRFYDVNGNLVRDAWENAKEWTSSKLGIDTAFYRSLEVNDVPDYYQGANHVRSENIDEIGGSYSVTESWILASGLSLEDFTVSTSTSNSDGLTKVSINGTITGLESKDSNFSVVSSKWANASTKFSNVQTQLLTRAQSYSGETLNISPAATSIGKNPVQGTINYSYEYDNRASNCVSGSKSESITITDVGTNDVFAAIPVLGRAAGPVLQAINTTDATTRSLNIELVMGPSAIDCSSIAALKSSLTNNPRKNSSTSGVIEDIITAVNPSGEGYSQTFRGQPQETWEPRTGRYSYQVDWTYQ